MNAETFNSHAFIRMLLGLLAVTMIPLAAPAQLAEIPYLTGRITDNAEILSPQVRARVAGMLEHHEEITSDQIAVLTMPSLEGESTEGFAARVFQSWKLGEKGKENGVLVLFSPGDRRIRIEVGRGLKERLTEMQADRIIRDTIAPRFIEGDYDRGVEDGIRALIDRLEAGEPLQSVPSQEEHANKESFFEGPELSIPERILIGSFIFGIIGLFTVVGVLTPGAGWFLYLFLIPFWAMFPLIVVGTHGALTLLVSYLIGFPAAKLSLSRADWYRKAKMALASKGVAQIGGFTVRSGSHTGSTWSSGGSQ
jgi:uncharacterized protein